MRRMDRGTLIWLGIAAVPSLAAATALVGLLQDRLGVPNASAVYILPVVVTALAAGTIGAIASAVGGILLYDFFFTAPLHTLVISDPGVWLNVVLLLFVGLVVGELTALLRSRAGVALVREHEALELFRVSRSLATRSSTAAVLREIATTLGRATGMDKVAIAIGPDDASEREVTSAPAGETGGRPPVGQPHHVLRRMPGDEPARWVRVHPARLGRTEPARVARFRIRIEVGAKTFGSIWAERQNVGRTPDRTATRLLAAAADQVGQALEQDRLALEARNAEISRESDALRAALLQSVSHDLRTPLAAIRAAVASLRPDSRAAPADRRASADGIEREVVRLDRLVRNLLDMSRIEAGVLRADRDVYELDDLVEPIIERMAPQLEDRRLEAHVAPEAVLVDPVFLDEILTNLIDNATKFTDSGTVIRITGGRLAADASEVRLTVEDGGLGVAPEELGRIFERFHRVTGSSGETRPGTGVGLAVVRGLATAMGARVAARPSVLGGLAVDLDLPAAALPPELTTPNQAARS